MDRRYSNVSIADSDWSSAHSSSTDGSRDHHSAWCCEPKTRRPPRLSTPKSDLSNDSLREGVTVVFGDSSGSNGLGRAGGAVASVSLAWNELPTASPDPRLDLRRFLRAGDVVNLLGGNVWGHCVLLLATPRAVEVPMLLDVEDPEEVKKSSGGPLVVKVLARQVPVYLCKILQSASNMLAISVGLCAIVVHPVTHAICVVKEVRGAVQICVGRRGGLVTAEIVMSPFNHKTLDYGNFRLAVQECFLVPQDTKWSFRTAIRSYLRDCKLKPSRYTTEAKQRELAYRIGEKWKTRPICSTVPVRMWQKYLMKMSYKELRCPPIQAPNEADPELRWVESVLNLVPIKDDRVLPDQLVKHLLETGAWRRLVLYDGPPPHRCQDLPAPREAEFFNAVLVPLCFRPFLPNIVNPEGFTVRLGANSFNIYCGRQFAKSQVLKAADGSQMTWNGCCGPLRGRQCDACVWLENRLPASANLPLECQQWPPVRLQAR